MKSPHLQHDNESYDVIGLELGRYIYLSDRSGKLPFVIDMETSLSITHRKYFVQNLVMSDVQELKGLIYTEHVVGKAL